MLGTNRIRLQTATEIVVHAHSNALSDLRVKIVQLPNILNTELIGAVTRITQYTENIQI